VDATQHINQLALQRPLTGPHTALSNSLSRTTQHHTAAELRLSKQPQDDMMKPSNDASSCCITALSCLHQMHIFVHMHTLLP